MRKKTIGNLSPFVQFLKSETSKKKTWNICLLMLKYDFYEHEHFYARHFTKIQVVLLPFIIYPSNLPLMDRAQVTHNRYGHLRWWCFCFLGTQPLSIRQLKKVIQFTYPSVSWLVPEFLYLPGWFIAAGTHKFWSCGRKDVCGLATWCIPYESLDHRFSLGKCYEIVRTN